MLDIVLDGNHHDGFESFHDMWDKGGIRATLFKCTEGLYFTDPAYNNLRQRAESVGMLTAAYHYASDEDGAKQADFLFKHANQPMLGVLDFEHNNRGTMTRSGAIAFVRQWAKLTNRWPMLYLNESTLHGLGVTAGEVLAHCKLWVAKYSNSKPLLPYAWDGQPYLWQASGTEPNERPRTCPGVKGFVDRSYFMGDASQLKAWWLS